MRALDDRIDFLAFETVRYHADGGIAHVMELFHRHSPTQPWKAAVTTFVNANVAFPQLPTATRAPHLLTAAEAQLAGAAPNMVAARYAAPLTEAQKTQSLDAASFIPSASTTGAVSSELHFLTEFAHDGSATVTWAARPGGIAIQVAAGILVLCSVQETITNKRAKYGNTQYFMTQDRGERAYGGLLAPGNYSQVTQTLLASLAVVVTATGPADVIASSSTLTSITGTQL